MKSTHIVHITATNAVNDTRIFQKECISAIAQGFRVTLIVCHDRDEILEGVHIKAMPRAKGRVSRMIGLTWKMYREAIKQDGDIYQLHHPDQIPAGLLLKLRGKRVIYDSHEAYRDKILSMRWIPAKLRRPARLGFGLYERLTSLAWDHIVVADAYTAQAFPARRVTIVPNYPLLDPVGYTANKANERPVLIYEGGLSDERGLQVMLDIARLLRHHSVELQLLGWCPFPDDEKRLQTANVRYFGKQSVAVLFQHLCQADLGLLLLQPVPAYSYAGENTNKLFEYMWCGLPVVASDFPNLRRIVDSTHCGICVDPCDPATAAQAILHLLSQPDLRKQMGQNGRQAVSKLYNWSEASKALIQTYQCVLRGNPKRLRSDGNKNRNEANPVGGRSTA